MIWTWLQRENLRREREFLLMATQNKSIKTNNTEAKLRDNKIVNVNNVDTEMRLQIIYYGDVG